MNRPVYTSGGYSEHGAMTRPPRSGATAIRAERQYSRLREDNISARCLSDLENRALFIRKKDAANGTAGQVEPDH